ncbi:FecR domain-containing protein [Sphingomonas morindae]|uniref:FecR domain-containing protein n=1 Tax=Sphingomonas morindae TaxID=1541170 RepID=A0ABY4XE62_9SPHN|nr:FecR domain-containing protein [Sphingomonas morindae]USI75232.1 FecR domain-containing protein [Sphingomonas morindae]
MEWLARSERGLTPEEAQTLDEWLSLDPRNLGAFVQAQAAWIHAERAMALGDMPGDAAEPALSPIPIDAPDDHASGLVGRRIGRRAAIVGGLTIAASAVGVGYIGRDRSRDIRTAVGEIRRVPLAGGAVATLDTDTLLTVGGTDDRQLHLARGRMFLDVPQGRPAPTFVKAGDLSMTMLRGGMGLKALEGTPLLAFVTLGDLLVTQGWGILESRRSLILDQNRSLELPSGADLSARYVHPVSPSQLDDLRAWQSGMIAFGGETLAMAVRAFDRYGPTRIMVTDPSLAAQQITGLFKADDPKGFATAIAASFGAATAVEGNVVHIVKKKVPPYHPDYRAAEHPLRDAGYRRSSRGFGWFH